MPKYDLHFDLVETPRQLQQLEDFMLAQVGAYDTERHHAWVEDVCVPAIDRDERRALAWWSNGKMIGDAVLKPVAPDVIELKNFRIQQGHEGRFLGSVMMAHVAIESKDLLLEKGLISPDANDLIVRLDTGAHLEAYFAHNGFTTIDRAELYVAGREEVIMERSVPLH